MIILNQFSHCCLNADHSFSLAMEANSIGSTQGWLGSENMFARELINRVCVNRSMGFVGDLAEKREKIQEKVVFY